MPPNNSIFYIIKHHSTVHTKQCLYIIPYFRVFCKRVTHIFLKIFIAVEPGTFLHRLIGAHELRQRVRPFRAAPFLHRLSGARELRQRVRPNGAAPFLHRRSGALELRKRVRPDEAAPFPAPAERGTRTAAGGFGPDGAAPFPAPAERGARTAAGGFALTGGEFFAEPQRGIRRLRTAGACRAPRRGQKGRTTCGFPSSLNSYLSLTS